MGSTKHHARRVREQLEEDGVYVVSASEARQKVREDGDLDAPWRDHIEEQFSQHGWTVDGEVYYHPIELPGEVEAFSTRLRSENRPVVSKGIVSQNVAGMAYPDGEWGDIIDETMRDEGWQVQEADGLYFLPPTELVTESALSFYLMQGFDIS